MRKLKIVTGLTGLSDVEISGEAEVITSRMDGNTNFQTPYPTIANIITLNSNYSDAIVKAEHGNLSDTAHKNELREALINALNALAVWVELNCQDNETILLTSGFQLRSPVERNRQPLAPDQVKLIDGIQSGEVVLALKKPLYAIAFIARYTYDMAGGIWINTEPFTTSKYTIRGLEVGRDVWAQVKSINNNGISVWGQPVLLKTIR